MLVVVLFMILAQHSDGCMPYDTVWQHWGHCSHSCGGGTRTRNGKSCVFHHHKTDNENCNENCLNGHHYSGSICHCPAWRTGRCCETCRHTYIANCMSGQKQCGGSPDNIKCTQCENQYYSGGYGKGCIECTKITKCAKRHCTNSRDELCDSCDDNRIYYKVTSDGKLCERMCSFNNHYCWPGTCGDELTKNCQCAPGFRRLSTPNETSCQPVESPSILTCNTIATGPNGERKRAMSNSSSTDCRYLTDFYGKYQPSQLEFELSAEYSVNITATRPDFITESNFGVTDATMYVYKKTIKGSEVLLSTNSQLKDVNKSVNATAHWFSSDNLTISGVKLLNGESMCLRFEAKGGGYLIKKDIRSNNILGPVPYHKTTTTREICYIYDNAPPVHCLERGLCSSDPLRVDTRITRSSDIILDFSGYSDPIPSGGKQVHASGIESYQISVNEVMPSKGQSKVDTKNLLPEKLVVNYTHVALNMTSDTPKLYCITLEVKDVADNIKQARRFVLYDNTSYIETNPDKQFITTSASSETGLRWQTHHNDVCISWKDYFFNKFYLDSQLLNPIESDTYGLITGVYEQSKGSLPVSGTPNVYGITKYMFSWSLNNDSMSKETNVPNFQNQTLCHHFDLADGQTYTLYIRPVDIANNTYRDSRIVHIDRSVPHINNIWLRKDGYKSLYVHDSKDLANMQLYFEALDPHSGIRNVEWTFGESELGSELATGTLGGGTIKENNCSSIEEVCYCPDVGPCEMFNYTISLNKLKAINKNQGNHNRNYYFKVKVTNNAMLTNIEHVDILVDDSPPEPGVVFEGPLDSPDIDYTSDDYIMVRWHGFIDHESGIKMYRLGLADRCLVSEDMLNYNNRSDIDYFNEILFTEKSVRIPANFTGKMFITVLALNNAMSPSDPVCSDGITRDISPPALRNVTIQNGKWSESVICHNGQPWLMLSSLSKIQLHPTSACSQLCLNYSSNHDIADSVPTQHVNGKDEDISEFMCLNLPIYTPESIIYIPNDHVYIKWDIEEDGSQIEDHFVGFGVNPSEAVNPSIMKYISTAKKPFFKRRHVGVGSNKIFYIFIRTTNKAGLEKITTIGPIIIDETPPLYKAIPKVQIEANHILVGWNNDTFYDMEQRQQIQQIFFQIEHDGVAVTPLLEWRLHSSKKCPAYNGGCFTYPLSRLQRQDTDLGLSFYISFYVYNNAGHKTKLLTPIFHIPSRYPPGHAIVTDIDPDTTNKDALINNDVNVHFTENTLCAKWIGFKHHESISLELGVGTNNATDDIIQFHITNNSNHDCIKSSELKQGVKYYFLVRSTCSGGHTISSSNGITIWDEITVLSSLKVSVGSNCLSSPPILQKEIKILNASHTYRIETPLQIGATFRMYTEDVNGLDIDVSSQEAKISTATDFLNKIYCRIVPYTEQPTITFKVTNPQINGTFAFNIIKCPHSNFLLPAKTVSINWFYSTNGTTPAVLYEAAVISAESNNSLTPIIFSKTVSNETHVFRDIDLQLHLRYKIAVRPCTPLHCLTPVTSDAFQIETRTPAGTIDTCEISIPKGKKCYNLNIQWKPFQSDSDISFYQWTISKTSEANHALLDWKTLQGNVLSFYKVSECVTLPVLPYAHLFGCVRAFATTGQAAVVCNKLHIHSDGPYSNDVIYDFDTSFDTWKTVLQILHSSNPGDKYKDLHEAELNFGTTSSLVAGAVTYGSERDITWYLMRSQHLPDKCSTSTDCIKTSSTTGYVTFDPELIETDVLYYICAHSNKTIVTRELFTETLEELRGCSNGFILDDTPPTGGVVHVKHHAGYLTDMNDILISWTGFKDNINATAFGYQGGIQQYCYSIGSRPGGSDIKHFTCVGLVQSTVERNAHIEDGSVIYVSVRAIDHSGYSTTVSSQELIVDTSTPTVGKILLGDGFYNTFYINSDIISIQLTGFEDKHSGIDHFEIGLGTHQDIEDIFAAMKYYDDHIQLPIAGQELQDGVVYYVILKAVNRAGLMSPVAYTDFELDRTPPTGGHVMEGSWKYQNDVDFQPDVSQIRGHWKGFIDVHSGIAYFRAALGSRPFRNDVEPFVDVGLRSDMTWSASFTPGRKYYITVEACNGAELCRTLSSDGIVLDNSPPIQGLVRVGSGEGHQKYQPHHTSVHIQWASFEDPHSGLDHFEACIGTGSNICDIVPYFTCLLQSSVIKTGLDLPSNTELYANVKAFNRVGMNVSKSSDKFMVDTSPPVVIQKPEILLNSNNVRGKTAQWEKSVLRVIWKFEDRESPITKHVISLVTHHEGHTPVEHIEIGSENTVTIHLDGKNWLHDGDKYKIIVTCCNEAGICSSEISSDILIDSTPPHVGGFKYPMSWENYIDPSGDIKSRLTLTWYGFKDPESEIDTYFITVSRAYNGNELSDGIVSYRSNETSDEQRLTFELARAIRPDDLLILTIWAKNNVGLNSTVSRISVMSLSDALRGHDLSKYTGTLEIEKHSCDIHFCNKDCTCAVFGQPCADVSSNLTCLSFNASEVETNNLPTIDVFGGLPLNRLNITASSACLSGHWKLNSRRSNVSIQRYEWSIGLSKQPVGEGVFDLTSERPWHDVGLTNEVVHCLPLNRSLIHGEEYIIYTRVWYSSNSFAVFKSNPILVDQSPPGLRRGQSIKDSDVTCSKDFDFIDWMHTITACWDGVFSEQQGALLYYTLALGTTAEADDIFQTTNMGLNTNKTITDVSLQHGTRYYFTVSAYNNVGLQTSFSSDGFVIDMDTPIAGVVFNTDRHKDATFQSSSSTFSLSWHGFVDHYSCVRSYEVAIVDDVDANSSSSKFIDVGLQTRFTFNQLGMEHNKTYYGLVKAYDGAGHVSGTVSSKGRTVDLTPPEAVTCDTYSLIKTKTELFFDTKDIELHITNDFIKNAMYKFNGTIASQDINVGVHVSIDRLHLTLPLVQKHAGLRQFHYTFISPFSGSSNITLLISSTSNITATINLSECLKMIPGQNSSAMQIRQIGPYSLAVNIMVMDEESSIYKVELGAGSAPGGFQVRTLSPVHGGNNEVLHVNTPHGSDVYVTAIAENYAGLRSIFYSNVVTMDRTPPILRDLAAEILVTNYNKDNDTNSTKKVVVKASWAVDDLESGTKYCFCAIGRYAGSDDVEAFIPAERNNVCLLEPRSIPHGTHLFVKVKCINHVELSVELTSHPLIVSIKPTDSNRAHVTFVSSDIESKQVITDNDLTPENISVQSNGSCIQIQWFGFDDKQDILRYEYRLLQNKNKVVDWTSSNRRQMATILGLQLHSDSVYTAEVRAINSGQYKSDPISGDIFIIHGSPKLSGIPLTMSRAGGKLHMDWTHVFVISDKVPVTFTIIVGSRFGFDDVIDIRHTTARAYDVDVPESMTILSSTEIHELFISVTCIYPTGLYGVYNTSYQFI